MLKDLGFKQKFGPVKMRREPRARVFERTGNLDLDDRSNGED